MHDQPTNRTLWDVTSGQRLRYGGAILAMALTNVFFFGAPLIGKFAIDVVAEQDFAYGMAPLASWFAGDYAGYLWASAGLSLLVTAIAGVFLYLRGRWAALASEAITERLRQSLYRRLHQVPAGFYDTADTGDLVQRCSSDVETLRVFLATHVVEIGRAIMLLLTVLPILFWLDSRLAWMSVCLMPILTIAAFIFFQKVKALFEQTDEAEARLTATLQENLTGIRVVRAFARQAFETEKFDARNADFRDHSYKLMRLMSLYWGISDFVAMTQLGIVLIVGGRFIMAGTLTVGDLFAFMTYIGMVIWPIRHLGRVLTDSGKAVIALGRVNHILSHEPEAPGVVPAAGRASGALAFSALRFAYSGDEQSARPPELDNIDLTIAPGETIGLVGPPGSGKTSLIRVLLRLYDYQSGSVTLDGHELRELDRHWLRSQIGVVFQDPFLYSRSIGGNLRVGRPAANDEDVRGACEDAAIWESIQSFPERFDAMVGERGVTLSGGQRQRLALARTLLKDPPILVLDDSLSAVDTGTERDILAALRRRQGRHTTLIVAHRLSSVRHADRIVVLEGGRISQIGSHDALAAQPGLYRRLCEIQGQLDTSIRDDLERVANARRD
ncbi:MAG: ABC transporter ATP-binding protein [Pseudomonadota bacterium]